MEFYSMDDEVRKCDPLILSNYMSRSSCETTEEEYLDKLQKIMSAPPCLMCPREISKIDQGIYLGTTFNAENVKELRRIGITHVINCSAVRKAEYFENGSPYNASETGVVGYLALNIRDEENYSMRAHFESVTAYIKNARRNGGNVLIVSSGVSASAAICMAFLMIGKNRWLLQAAKLVKDARRTALCNVGFMAQLVEFATRHGYLDPAPEKVRAPTFGTSNYKYRLMTAHLPEVRLY